MLEILHPHQSMIRKSGYRLSEKIMLRQSMIRKSGYRFSEKIMLRQKGGWNGLPLRALVPADRGKFQGCFNSMARGYTMPAFTFEKISPPVRRGPIAPIVKKQRGVIVKILDRFVEARVKRTSRKEQGVTARQPKPQK
jgi:hypothetical protein